MKSEATKETTQVPAVESAVRILNYLSRYKHRESNLSELSKDLGINKSTCYRILKELGNYRLVSFDEKSKKYSLGSYLVVLGARAAEFTNHLELAKPHLKWLCEQTEQTSVLLESIPNKRLMYVAKEEPNSPVRVTVNVGQQFPLTSASFGKCFMAFKSEAEIEEIIGNNGFKQFTSKTITNVKQFKLQLQQVRENGYAVSFEEHTRGVFGVAAPVFDLNGRVNLVIACIGLTMQLGEDSIRFYGEQVKQAAGKITKILGGRLS